LTIVKKIRKKYKKQFRDFESYWYGNQRFNFRPTVGYTHKTYKSNTININNNGFRSKYDYIKKSPKSKKRFAFFGSSALFGIPILNDEQTIPNKVKNLFLERHIEIECYNFSLIGSKISNDFNLCVQTFFEYGFDFVILLNGYNDLRGAYHGHKFEDFIDTINIYQNAYYYDSNKDNLSFYFNNFFTKFINKLSNSLESKSEKGNKLRFDFLNSLKKIDIKEIDQNYSFCIDYYLSYLNSFFNFVNYQNIPTLYIHQPTIYSLKKELSTYEKEFVENTDKRFGLYKNSNKTSEINEFSKAYTIQYDKSSNLCKEKNILNIDIDKIITLVASQKDFFYDDCHLFELGSQIISEEIFKSTKNLVSKEGFEPQTPKKILT